MSEVPSVFGPRTPPRLLSVKRTQRVGSHLLRVTLEGEQLRGFPVGVGGAHIKLFFPRDGQAAPVLPRLGESGPIWPPADQRPITRTYSVREFRREENELDVDFVLHEEAGPACDWARRALPGAQLGLAGPGGPWPLLAPAEYSVLVADLSAVPALSAILENLDSTAQGVAWVHVPTEEDCVELKHPPGLSVRYWVGPPGRTSELQLAVRAEELPSEDLAVWLAGESSMVVALRQYFRKERGLPKNKIYAVPYWKVHLNEEAYHEQRHVIMDAMEED